MNTATKVLIGAASVASATVIDMDVNISERPHEHHSGLASHLLEMSATDGSGDYIEKNLDNFFNIQIYANILIGSNKQEFPLIFDSGSSWVWVGHDKCTNCANKHKFDSHQSTSFTQKTMM